MHLQPFAVCMVLCVYSLHRGFITELRAGKLQQTESGQSTCCCPSGPHDEHLIKHAHLQTPDSPALTATHAEAHPNATSSSQAHLTFGK